MTTLHWFCHDPEGEGLTWHATEAALQQAAACIDGWRDDEWPSEVEEITVGCVTHTAAQANIQRPALPLDAEGDDQEGVHWQGVDDYRCNYVMRPTETVPPAVALPIAAPLPEAQP